MVQKVAILILLIASALYPIAAAAHPTTFKGGTAIEQTSSSDMHHSAINYTFEPGLALGADLHWMRDDRKKISRYELARVNWLLKRWNEPASQANIYLSGGVGNSRVSGENSLGSLLAAQADWETRRWYTLAGATVLSSEGGRDFQHYVARAGVAPYLAEFDQLNTFVIMQALHSPQMEEDWRVGPVVRFFYGRVLLEVGVDFEGELSGTVMFHLG